TGGLILANAGTTVELNSDTITGGTISLAGPATTATLGIEGTVSLAPTTTTTLSTTGNNLITAVTDELTTTPTLNNAGTIQGAGILSGGRLVVNNSSTIHATVSGEAGELVLATLATFGTTGTLEATVCATPQIDSLAINTGGLILANAGTTVE